MSNDVENNHIDMRISKQIKKVDISESIDENVSEDFESPAVFIKKGGIINKTNAFNVNESDYKYNDKEAKMDNNINNNQQEKKVLPPIREKNMIHDVDDIIRGNSNNDNYNNSDKKNINNNNNNNINNIEDDDNIDNDGHQYEKSSKKVIIKLDKEEDLKEEIKDNYNIINENSEKNRSENINNYTKVDNNEELINDPSKSRNPGKIKQEKHTGLDSNDLLRSDIKPSDFNLDTNNYQTSFNLNESQNTANNIVIKRFEQNKGILKKTQPIEINKDYMEDNIINNIANSNELNNQAYKENDTDDDDEDDKYSYSIFWHYIPFVSTIVPAIGHLAIVSKKRTRHNFYSSKFVDTKPNYTEIPYKFIPLNLDKEKKKLFNKVIVEVDKKYSRKEFSPCGKNGYHYVAYLLEKLEYNNKEKYSAFDVFKLTLEKAEYTSNKAKFICYGGMILIFIIIIIIIIVAVC